MTVLVPDPTCQVITDPDLTCQVILDPDPDPERWKFPDLSNHHSVWLLFFKSQQLEFLTNKWQFRAFEAFPKCFFLLICYPGTYEQCVGSV